MDNVSEIVALLRKQADLEVQIMNGNGTAVATERNSRRLTALDGAFRGHAASLARIKSVFRHYNYTIACWLDGLG